MTDPSDFTDLVTAPALLRGIADLGFTEPTAVQTAVIPHAQRGRDVIACAHTGSGKTAAFVLPVLEALLQDERKRARGGARPRALVLAPTRELADQIASTFRDLGKHAPVTTALFVGGVRMERQIAALRKGIDVAVGTPGRILDLTRRGALDLGGVRFFVLDEADRMLDMGFIDQVRGIARHVPRKRQTMLLSATLDASVERLAQSLLREPVFVDLTGEREEAPDIDMRWLALLPNDKPRALLEVLEEVDGQVLVFVNTRRAARLVGAMLSQRGIAADALHGDLNQRERYRVLERFRSGALRVVVATDVAARGLDIEAVACVVNYDMPREAEAFVHRIGRTARAGARGQAVHFVTAGDRPMVPIIRRVLAERQRPTSRDHAVTSSRPPARGRRMRRVERRGRPRRGSAL